MQTSAHLEQDAGQPEVDLEQVAVVAQHAGREVHAEAAQRVPFDLVHQQRGDAEQEDGAGHEQRRDTEEATGWGNVILICAISPYFNIYLTV